MDKTKSLLTPEQWKEIEKEMNSIFGKVELMCDGFKVTLGYARGKKPTDISLATYVNGFVKGEWFGKYGKEDEPPEAKFFPIKSTYAYSASSRKSYEKLSKKDKKKLQKEFNYNAYKKIQYRDMFFGSFRSLKRHFAKVCESIEILKIGSEDYIQDKKSSDNPSGIDR